MIPSTEEKATISDIVVERCNAQARRWNARGSDAIGAVYVKVCENLRSVEHLEKPLEHYVRKTADREAWRFFETEKNAVRSCVAADALEVLTLQSSAVGRNFDDRASLVEAGRPSRDQLRQAERKRKCFADALDRQRRRLGDSSVLESLVKAETSKGLLKAVRELPSERREALLVHPGAQAFDPEGDDLPNSIRGLARQRGCSPQHLCNVATQEKRRLKRQLQ
jgi:hypothetical protein